MTTLRTPDAACATAAAGAVRPSGAALEAVAARYAVALHAGAWPS